MPWLFAVAHSAVAFSVYFALGVVADRGLSLTPAILAVAGIAYVVTTLTYVEGGVMFNERGGSNTLARHAFNEFASFVAGWAILIDYVIVIALAAISVPHYLQPISSSLADGAGEIVIALGVVGLVAVTNISGYTGSRRQGILMALTTADLFLQFAVIAIGLAVLWDPEALTAPLELFGTPGTEDVLFAFVVSMVALAGIEAASDLAPDLAWRREDLRKVVGAGSLFVPLIYVGMAFVALMALPVVAGPEGPQTRLSSTYLDAPVLGIVSAFQPAWLGDIGKWTVVAVAPAILIFAANVTMLGLSRHVYVLATNRQIPSWLGKLGSRSTPYVAIVLASLIAAVLIIPGDIEFLAGLFAFGAMLAISIAHVSLIRLRYTQPDRDRPYSVPGGIRIGGGVVPVPAVIGALLTGGALVCVIVLHGAAAYVGAIWMLIGIVGYVVYRKVFGGIPLTERVSVPERALHKERPDVELESVLVPVFGEGLDDDIVGTAARLSVGRPGEGRPRLELLYVVDLPLTVPLGSPPPVERIAAAEAALARAREVAEEYPTVDVVSDFVSGRNIGETIVAEARRRGVEAIVLGGEPPTRIKGGAILGGVRAARPAEIGAVTAYVLQNSPTRVLLTAPSEA